MRPYRRYKSYRPYRGRAQAIQSAIWMIGLGVLFLTGHWWPGIMILIGLSMVMGALVRGGEAMLDNWDEPQTPPEMPQPPAPPSPFRTPAASPNPPMFRTESTPAPKPVRLPDLCPNCGAPTRTLRQRADNPYECPYCGSEIGARES